MCCTEPVMVPYSYFFWAMTYSCELFLWIQSKFVVDMMNLFVARARICLSIFLYQNLSSNPLFYHWKRMILSQITKLNIIQDTYKAMSKVNVQSVCNNLYTVVRNHPQIWLRPTQYQKQRKKYNQWQEYLQGCYKTKLSCKTFFLVSNPEKIVLWVFIKLENML